MDKIYETSACDAYALSLGTLCNQATFLHCTIVCLYRQYYRVSILLYLSGFALERIILL